MRSCCFSRSAYFCSSDCQVAKGFLAEEVTCACGFYFYWDDVGAPGTYNNLFGLLATWFSMELCLVIYREFSCVTYSVILKNGLLWFSIVYASCGEFCYWITREGYDCSSLSLLLLIIFILIVDVFNNINYGLKN